MQRQATEHREERQCIPENIERKKRLQTVRPNDKDRDTETERKQKQGKAYKDKCTNTPT
jgi:hypothetical protein